MESTSQVAMNNTSTDGVVGQTLTLELASPPNDYSYSDDTKASHSEFINGKKGTNNAALHNTITIKSTLDATSIRGVSRGGTSITLPIPRASSASTSTIQSIDFENKSPINFLVKIQKDCKDVDSAISISLLPTKQSEQFSAQSTIYQSQEPDNYKGVLLAGLHRFSFKSSLSNRNIAVDGSCVTEFDILLSPTAITHDKEQYNERS